MKNTSAADIR